MGKTKGMFHQKERGLRITRLMARDGCDCALCREPLDRKIKDESSPLYVTFDHIIPVSDGGCDDLINLQLTHRKCNQERGADPLVVDEWVA